MTGRGSTPAGGAQARTRYRFFLGGRDLEMATIRGLVEEVLPGRVHDRGLDRGARASCYAEEIRRAMGCGESAILVELEPDMDLPFHQVIVVDDHGDRAGADRPTSLHQVFALLCLPPARWTRWLDLVAANDRGRVGALLALDPPSTAEEVASVRAADREAQGVTPEEEEEAAEAVRAARVVAGGRLTALELPHDRPAPAADRMEPALGGPGYENLLILTPASVHVFGDGGAVVRLDAAYPGGRYGGSLPGRGFWVNARAKLAGAATLDDAAARVVPFL